MMLFAKSFRIWLLFYFENSKWKCGCQKKQQNVERKFCTRAVEKSHAFAHKQCHLLNNMYDKSIRIVQCTRDFAHAVHSRNVSQ